MADESPRWMRIRRGRVMHAVEPNGMGWLRSVCRKPKNGHRRAFGPPDEWSAERHWYPDCAQCVAALAAQYPTEEEKTRD